MSDTMSTTEGEAWARTRWLVVGPFSSAPSGRRLKIDASNFAATLEAAQLTVAVELPDALSDGGKQRYQLRFDKLRAFSLSEVLKSEPKLAELSALAEALVAPDANQRKSVAEAAATCQRLGATRLQKSLEALSAPPPSSGSSGSALIDQVLAGAPNPAASAVDSFVSAIRGSGSSLPPEARKARSLLEDALYATAKALLARPEVVALESAWRGLKLAVDHATADAGMVIEVVDVAGEGVIETVTSALAGEAFDRPSAVFITDRIGSAATLEALANLGDEAMVPVVAELPLPWFKLPDAAALVTALEKEPKLPDDFRALREQEAARWLFAATNEVVSLSEGTGVAERVVLSSPVFGVLAMLARSFRETGAFGKILGPEAGLKTPGGLTLKSGAHEGSVVPTGAFVSAKSQALLASFGILALGSARNAVEIRLSAAPSVRAAADAVPLPAQIQTGRIVRFAQWCRDQIPPGTDDDGAQAIFAEAAKVFLFGGLEKGAELTAKVVNESGARMVVIAARVHPLHAGIALELAFSLPLPA